MDRSIALGPYNGEIVLLELDAVAALAAVVEEKTVVLPVRQHMPVSRARTCGVWASRAFIEARSVRFANQPDSALFVRDPGVHLPDKRVRIVAGRTDHHVRSTLKSDYFRIKREKNRYGTKIAGSLLSIFYIWSARLSPVRKAGK